MTGELWIDGFNLFHQWGPTRELFRARENIALASDRGLSLLAQALGRRRARITVFMDGGLQREAGTRYGMRVRWGGPGVKADDLMAEALRGRRQRVRDIVAVSQDRSLLATCRGLGAATLSADDFLGRFLQKPRARNAARAIEQSMKNRHLSRHEVDAWLEVFATPGDDTDEGR